VIAAVGPGTARNASVFIGGTKETESALNNGKEIEGAFDDRNWETTSAHHQVHMTFSDANYFLRVGASRAPRISVALFRGYTAIYSDPQYPEAQPKTGGTNDHWRLSFALSQALGMPIALPKSGSDPEHYNVNHYDELAVDVASNAYATVAYDETNAGVAALLPHRKWMGRPRGEFFRYVHPDDLAALAFESLALDAQSSSGTCTPTTWQDSRSRRT